MIRKVHNFAKQSCRVFLVYIRFVQPQIRSLIRGSSQAVSIGRDRVDAVFEAVEAGQRHPAAVCEAAAKIDGGTQAAASIDIESVPLVIIGRELQSEFAITDDRAAVGV